MGLAAAASAGTHGDGVNRARWRGVVALADLWARGQTRADGRGEESVRFCPFGSICGLNLLQIWGRAGQKRTPADNFVRLGMPVGPGFAPNEHPRTIWGLALELA